MVAPIIQTLAELIEMYNYFFSDIKPILAANKHIISILVWNEITWYMFNTKRLIRF